MDKIYFTNNICETIHSKINYYLPKKSTNIKDFILCLTKIFINCNNIENNLIKHDYISRTLLILIKKYDLNKNPKWITFNEYITENKKLTKKFVDENHHTDIRELINLINNINLGKNDDEIIDNNSESDKSKDNSLSEDYDINMNIKSNNSNENSYESMINEKDKGINDFIKESINEDIISNDKLENDKSEHDDSEHKHFKLPLKERVAKRIKNFDKINEDEKSSIDKYQYKSRKRKVIYPKDGIDDNSSSENKSKNNSVKKIKKKGWKRYI